MATIYITDETREMLNRLAVAGKRGISDQVGYLAEKEVKGLGGSYSSELTEAIETLEELKEQAVKL